MFTWRSWNPASSIPRWPDAEPFLAWRRAMNDEEWVNFGALDDDAWYDRVKADFGMDARGSASAAGILSGSK